MIKKYEIIVNKLVNKYSPISRLTQVYSNDDVAIILRQKRYRLKEVAVKYDFIILTFNGNDFFELHYSIHPSPSVALIKGKIKEPGYTEKNLIRNKEDSNFELLLNFVQNKLDTKIMNKFYAIDDVENGKIIGNSLLSKFTYNEINKEF